MFEPVHLDQIKAFAVSLAIGLLMGLEREGRPGSRAGLRTFALTAVVGTLTALLSERTGSVWPLALALVAISGNIIVANAIRPDPKDPGTTSVAAALVCFCLGAIVWYGYTRIAGMIAICSTVLLYFKAELHGVAARVQAKDWISFLQFAVLALIILPILPDQGFGPFEAINPHQAWVMVVLISGVSIAGYFALRLAGDAHGTVVIGLFGGLVSSTASTLIYSRHARSDEQMIRSASVIIVLANLIMLLRLTILAGVLAPTLLVPMLEAMGVPLLLGLLSLAVSHYKRGPLSNMKVPEMQNPAELKAALSFGAIYAIVLFCVAWLSDAIGNSGVYVVALVSGLTDVDAITLSSFRLFELDKIHAHDAVVAIGLAAISNLIFKSGLVISIGGRTLFASVAPTLIAVGIGLAGTLIHLAFFWPV